MAAASAPSSAAASATDRAIGPAVSCAGEIGTMPARLTSPSVGLTPTIPQALAGLTIEPSVSVPDRERRQPGGDRDAPSRNLSRTGCGRRRAG